MVESRPRTRRVSVHELNVVDSWPEQTGWAGLSGRHYYLVYWEWPQVHQSGYSLFPEPPLNDRAQPLLKGVLTQNEDVYEEVLGYYLVKGLEGQRLVLERQET